MALVACSDNKTLAPANPPASAATPAPAPATDSTSTDSGAAPAASVASSDTKTSDSPKPSFAAQPSLDSKLIRELATCRWVGNGDALLLLGPPGVGKSHLAVALGREAIQHGYSTLFTAATALVTH